MLGAHGTHARWPAEVDSTTAGPPPMAPLDIQTAHTAGGCGWRAPGISYFPQWPNRNHPKYHVDVLVRPRIERMG